MFVSVSMCQVRSPPPPLSEHLRWHFFFGRQTIILIATLAGRNNNKNKTKKKNKKKRSWIQSSIMRARQILLGSL